MKKASPDPQSSLDRIRSWARTKAHGPSPLSPESNRSSVLPLSNPTSTTQSSVTRAGSNNDTTNVPPFPSTDANGISRQSTSKTAASSGLDNISSTGPPSAPPPEGEGSGTVIENDKPKKNIVVRFWQTLTHILLSSWINILLVFVPVGIAVDVAKLNPTIVFVMNAIAIVPLAGLLSHATESVAKRMGDTVGALMNVTFGNAVELIIFMYVYLSGDQDKKEREALLKALSYQSRPISSNLFSSPVHYLIALSKDEIRIVQASLLGSILANLLLILGMCFLFGGLKYREQIYNSTVTQMSACLLSLSVMSLLLPTAFHASFTDEIKADIAVLKVSRGTSVIILLVYLLYLLFQLKSHAYMYESTPQHIIDEESAPGPVAAWMDTSSSDDSSSSSDSDDSRGSNTTAGRIKRVMRGGRRHRKSSAGSKDGDHPTPTRSPSYATSNASPILSDIRSEESSFPPVSGNGQHRFGAIDLNEDADDEVAVHDHRSRTHSISERKSRKKEKKHRKRQEKEDKKKGKRRTQEELNEKIEEPAQTSGDGINEPRRVDFAVPPADLEAQVADPVKKPFALRNLHIRPAIPKTFSQTVFSNPAPAGAANPQHDTPPVATGPIPRVRYGIRRTNSLPDRLNQTPSGGQGTGRVNSSGLQSVPSQPLIMNASMVDEEEENISRTTAVVLLLASTGLVALCAEFMVSSINSVTKNTPLGETFVGLIIVPIVGNAAEHVTAVTVAHKNKMDLALGVAVGSSIQIALFVTPFVVLLGWAMGKEMSLYFTLFETVSLFVSVFVVNFLVLDGRSNYLEGALLCSAYVIIAVAAFFYPIPNDQSILGGNANATSKMVRSLSYAAGHQIGVTLY